MFVRLKNESKLKSTKMSAVRYGIEAASAVGARVQNN